MAYQLFESKAAKFGSPQFTIRSGRIAFNADAGDILCRTGAKFAHLLWDSEASRFAVRATAKKDDRAFKVTFRQGRRGGTISAESFLKYIQWQADGPVVVAASWNGREHILEANLPAEHIGTRKNEAQERLR